jgi:hypothetical protein
MKCSVSHEVSLGGGKFKFFVAGLDYEAPETVGREKYFEPEEKQAPEIPEPVKHKKESRGHRNDTA